MKDNICKADVAMNYVNYDKSIVQTHRIKIIGWPESIPFIAPSSMTHCDDVRNLVHALQTSKCHWAQLSKRQVEEHMENICQREAAGEAIGHRCKERADKGKKRKRHCEENADTGEDTGNDSNSYEAPQTRARRKGKAWATGSRRTFRSKHLISSDEDSKD